MYIYIHTYADLDSKRVDIFIYISICGGKLLAFNPISCSMSTTDPSNTAPWQGREGQQVEHGNQCTGSCVDTSRLKVVHKGPVTK